MAYLTFDRLNKETSSRIKGQVFEKAYSLNESIDKAGTSDKRIFLSYRRNDIKYVKPIVAFLKSRGVKVYIDYLDDTLPNPPDHTTAKILRDSLTKCQKFILLATPNSKESNWMPWELGLGDGHTGYENTIIFPLVRTDSYWDEREYYKIYGYIEEVNSKDNSTRDWAVFYPDGTAAIWLWDWLSK
ncbi:MAG: toll/interleukin-1 receptor domain-containing protein [Bacteroidia bacterium]|nr:toll/interleukin-1 receptor domain-containing protein [Bacteroidia bacterium]